MIKRLRRLRQLGSRGDTIVEVLIVLAVLGLALSISYASASRGLQQSRNAQEHSEALGIINSQVELLRSAFAHQAGAVIEAQATSGPFCLSTPTPPDTVKITAITKTGANGFNENLASDPLNTAEYIGPCNQNTLYYVSIVGRGSGVYDFRVRWDGIGQLGRQQEELTYKIGNVVVTPTSGYTDGEVPPPPPLSGVLDVVVKAIPPAAGNTTPSCGAAATQLKSGTTVSLTDNTTGSFVGNKSTNASSIASFTGIQQGDSFAANIARSGWQVCSSDSPKSAGVPPPTPAVTATIRPICTTTTTTTYGWVWGNRRADLDGYYYTWPPAVPAGYYPGADSSFVAGNYRAGGTFVYVYSGDWSRIGEGLLYYWLWEVSWQPVSTTTTNHCPS